MENSKNVSQKHGEDCAYKDDDCLQYCFMELMENKMVLISAIEISFFDELLESAKNKDSDIKLDFEVADKEPYQLVYGALILNADIKAEYAKEMAHKLAGYGLVDIDEEEQKMILTVSGYKDICFGEQCEKKNSIPFCALMQSTHKFDEQGYSISMFPMLETEGEKATVWECMVNRPFLLACRYSEEFVGEEDSWQDKINCEKVYEIAKIADIVMPEE